MSSLSITMAKANFFDRTAVLRSVGRARRQILSKAGAYVRQRAKTSMRKRKRPSLPGQPPSAHVGLLRQFLFFAWDPTRESVVVGPARLNRPGMAPETLEYGGGALLPVSRWVSGARHGNRRQIVSGTKPIRIAARPYMRPALDAERHNFAQLWRDSVRR